MCVLFRVGVSSIPSSMFCGGGVGALGALSGVWPAMEIWCAGSGESAIAVLGGDIGTSSTFKLCALLNDTRGFGTAGLPGKSMNWGAPYLRVESDCVLFSSSSMIGRRLALLTVRDCSDETLPFVGDRMGDLAGL